MSETTQPTPPVTADYKLSLPAVEAQLRGYLAQADSSLNQLQQSTDAANSQLGEWNRMRLMILGQKQLAVDLLNKLVENSKAAPVDAETK